MASRRVGRRAVARPKDSLEQLRDLAATPEGQDTLGRITRLRTVEESLDIGELTDIHAVLGGRGPAPATIVVSLVQSRIRSKASNEAIIESWRDATGSLVIKVNPNARPSLAGTEVRRLLEQKQAIDGWLRQAEGGGRLRGVPLKAITKSDQREVMEDVLIVMLGSAGWTNKRIADVFAVKLWRGQKGLAERVKKRFQRSMVIVGPANRPRQIGGKAQARGNPHGPGSPDARSNHRRQSYPRK